MAMDAYPVIKLPEEQIVVCVCSTTGQACHLGLSVTHQPDTNHVSAYKG